MPATSVPRAGGVPLDQRSDRPFGIEVKAEARAPARRGTIGQHLRTAVPPYPRQRRTRTRSWVGLWVEPETTSQMPVVIGFQ
jgi:hypothetical protein